MFPAGRVLNELLLTGTRCFDLLFAFTKPLPLLCRRLMLARGLDALDVDLDWGIAEGGDDEPEDA